mgnify:CR=1 FL=1
MKKSSTPVFRFIDILNEAKSLYLLQIKTFFALAFIFALLKQAGSFFLERSVHLTGDHLTLKQPVLLMLTAIIVLLVSILLSALIQRFAYNAYQLKKHTFRQCWEMSLQKLPRLFITGLIVYLLSAIGVALYVIPGVLVFTFLFIAQPLILFDDLPVLQSIKTSLQWVAKHYFIVLNVAIVNLLLVYLPNIFINFFINNTANTVSFGIDEVVSIFINALIFPYLCLLVLVVYHKLHQATHLTDGSTNK